MRLLIAGLTLVAAALAAAGPAHAQAQSPMLGGGAIGQRASANAQQHTDEPSKAKANDKAYNAALKNLPDKQYDPWRGVR
jgi:hypothetical protein